MKTIQTAKRSRSQKGRHRLRPVRFVVLVFVAILFTSSGWQLYQLHSEVTGKVAQLNQEKSRLLEEKKQLEDEIVLLNTPSYVEQLAREQLGLVRKGEIRIAPKNQ